VSNPVHNTWLLFFGLELVTVSSKGTNALHGPDSACSGYCGHRDVRLLRVVSKWAYLAAGIMKNQELTCFRT